MAQCDWALIAHYQTCLEWRLISINGRSTDYFIAAT
jgi:hypothetical protein